MRCKRSRLDRHGIERSAQHRRRLSLRRGEFPRRPARGPVYGTALYLQHLPDAGRGGGDGYPQSFELLSGSDTLATYRFNSGVAEHHFCSVCGIYTHHRRRSAPGEYGINVACLEGVSPFDFAEIVVNDGERHPSDHDGRTRVAGTLLFKPAE